MEIIPEVVIRAGMSMWGPSDPLATCRTCRAAGARRINLRDLGGDVASLVHEPHWLSVLLAEHGLDVQLDCAGVQPSRLEVLAEFGCAGYVLDAHSVADPLYLRWALDIVGGRLTVELQGDGPYMFGVDAKLDAMLLVDAARQLHVAGARSVIYRDMTGDAPQWDVIEELADLCAQLEISLQLADAVSSVADLAQVRRLQTDTGGLWGLIIGAPLFDGRLTWSDVL